MAVLDKTGLQQVLNGLAEKFDTKLETLYINENTLTPEKNKISLQHISVEPTEDGVRLTGQEVAEYTLTSNDSEEYAKVYNFNKVTDGTTEVIGTINIPKDFFLTDVQIAQVTAEDKSEGGKFENDDNFKVGDKYIDFTVGVKNGRKTEQRHFYINFNDIVPNTFTAGNGISIENNVINVVFDNDVLYLKNNALSVKEADGNGQKGIISLPEKTDEKSDYLITIDTDGTVSYTKVINFTTEEINNLFN